MSYPRVHPTAVIGDPPEWRDWKPGMPFCQPEVHETAQINAFATVDGGVFVPTRIGPRTWLMAHTHVGHDAQVGADCELSPGVVIGGMVKIGDRVRVGINACVRPEVTIGDGARIGAGAVVVKDVPPGETWCGNPAAKLGAHRCVACGATSSGHLCELCAPLAGVA